MSGTLTSMPGFPGFTATNFRINNPTQVSETFGGKLRRVGLGTSFYTFTAKFPPMTKLQAGPIIGFISSQYGMLDSFQMYLPDQSYPLANYQGNTPVVNGNYNAGVKQVTFTTNLGNTLVLRAGDFFKFTGDAWLPNTAYTLGQYVRQGDVDYVCTEAHTSGVILDSAKFSLQTKVYMCIADCTTSAGGGGTLNFSGSLTQPLPNGAKINVTAVPFTVMLDNDVQEYEVGIGRIFNMELDLRELL
jgi:hypothetical protein